MVHSNNSSTGRGCWSIVKASSEDSSIKFAGLGLQELEYYCICVGGYYSDASTHTVSLTSTMTFLTRLSAMVDTIFDKLHIFSKFAVEQGWCLYRHRWIRGGSLLYRWVSTRRVKPKCYRATAERSDVLYRVSQKHLSYSKMLDCRSTTMPCTRLTPFIVSGAKSV